MKTSPVNMSLTDEDKERLDEIGKQLGIPYRSATVREMTVLFEEQRARIDTLSEVLKELEALTETLIDTVEEFLQGRDAARSKAREQYREILGKVERG